MCLTIPWSILGTCSLLSTHGINKLKFPKQFKVINYHKILISSVSVSSDLFLICGAAVISDSLYAHNYGSHVTENQVGIDIFIADNHQNMRDTLC